MKDEQAAMLQALNKCGFAPASWEKRLVRDLVEKSANTPELALTPRQDWALRRTYYRYRRQHGHPNLPKPADFDTPPVTKKVKQPDGNVFVCVRPSVSEAMARDLERLKAWNEGKPQ